MRIPERPLSRRRWPLRVLVLAAGLVALVFDVHGWPYLLRLVPDSDFRLYYSAAWIGRGQGWQHIYESTLQQQAESSIAPGTRWLPFINPPPLAWLVAPLTALPYPAADVLWSLLMGTLLLVASQVAALSGLERRLVYAASALLFVPVMFTLAYGQVVPLVALAIVLGSRLLAAGRPSLAGLALVGIALKPQLAILVLPLLLLAGHYRTVVVSAAGIAALAVASLATLGTAGTRQYLALLSLASGFPEQRQWTLWLVEGRAAWPLAALAVGLAVLIAVRARRREQVHGVVAAGTVASLAVATYVNLPDFTMLLVAGWLAVAARPTKAQIAAAVAVWVGVDLQGIWLAPTYLLAVVLLLPLAREAARLSPGDDGASQVEAGASSSQAASAGNTKTVVAGETKSVA